MKATHLVITLFALFLAGSTFLWLTTHPSYNESKAYSLEGRIIMNSSTEQRPQYMFVYYPYYLLQYLCRQNNLAVAKINWINDDEGKFSIFLSVPASLKEVIVTPDCAKCQHQSIKLDNISSPIVMYWKNSNKCDSNLKVAEESNYAILESQRLSGIVEEKLAQDSFNYSEKSFVREYTKRAASLVTDYTNSATPEEALKNAYHANWFAWSARYRIEKTELFHCLSDADKIVEQKKAESSCYVPDSKSYQDYLSVNNTYISFTEYSVDWLYSDKNNTEIRRNVQLVAENWQRLYEENQKCKKAYLEINETFNIQKPYCAAQKAFKTSSLLGWIIAFIFIGIFIQRVISKWEK